MIFKETDFTRSAAIQIIESKAFEYVMITVILMNSLQLSLIDYQDRDSKTVYNQTLDKVNFFFTIVFIIEASIKIFAQGLLFHPNAYLRSGWNIIDFLVVVFGIIEISAGTVSLKSLRIVRIFRPLKSLNAISTIRRLITALINSLPDFANIIFFQAFVFVLFATIGLHQYNGVYNNACRTTTKPTGDHWDFDYSFDRLCTSTGYGNFECPSPMICATPDNYPQVNLETERMYERAIINYGITNYDNIGRALLAVFQIVTSDTWYQQLCNLMDADLPWFGAIFCLLMIIIGQFFLMSLILAVIIYSFINSQKKELQKEIEEFQKEYMEIENEKSQTQGRGEHSSPFELLERNLESIENICEEIQDLDQMASLVNDQKKKRKKKRNKKSMKSRPGSVYSKALSLNPYEIEEEVSDQSSVSSVALSDRGGNQGQKVGGFLKDQAVKRKVVNLFKSKGQEEVKAVVSRQSKKDLTVINDGFSLSFKQRQTKSTFYKKQKFSSSNLNKKQNDDDQNLNGIFKQIENNQQLIQEGEQNIKPQQSDYEESISNQTYSEGPKISNAKLAFLKQSTLRMKQRQSTVNASAGLLKLQLLGLSKNENGQGIQEEESNDNSSSADLIIFIKAKSLRECESKGAQLFQKIFKQYIEVKIQNEYEEYFKTVLKEAHENQNNNNSNMREIVGIKVGLEYMKGKDAEQERLDEQKRSMDNRQQSHLIYRIAIKIMLAPMFNRFMTIAIVINTVILSLDKYPIDQETNYVVEKLNIFFTILFIVELVIRLIATGIKSFYKNQWFHIFDTIIVIGSAVDIVVSQILNAQSNDDAIYRGSAITALRAIRMMRVFKLSREWKRFELLLETMGNTLKDVASFSFLLFVFTFIFTLLGLELFAHQAKLDPDTNYVDLVNGVSPTFNFDNFMNSFSLVFIILTNDGQAAIYYNYYRAVTPIGSTIFWILLVVVGQKIILNLFVAILLENFDEGALKQKMHDYEQEQLAQGIQSKPNRVAIFIRDNYEKFVNKINQIVFKRKQQTSLSLPKQISLSKRKLNLGLKQKEIQESKQRAKQEEDDEHEQLIGKSLFLFSPDNFIRKFLFRIISDRKFDVFIILVILLSSIELAMNGPLLDPNSEYYKNLSKIDLITTIIFIVECIIKIVTFGFLFNDKWSYMKRPWHVLDFIIVVLSIISQTSLSTDFKVIKVLRILRLISRHQGLKVAVRALYYALPNILNVTVIMLIFFLIFGVIGVSQFKGKFYVCQEDIDIGIRLSHKWDCMNAGGIWDTHVYTFDDIPNAMVTLFVMSTTAGWQDVLMNSITSTDIDYVFQEYRDPVWTIFFILFMVIGFFFFLNLFIGVVVTTFNSEHDRLGGNDLLTEKQREWIDLKLLILRAAPIKKMTPISNKLSKICFKFVSNPWFERFIQISIVTNSICLILKWYQQPDEMTQALEIINYIFTSIFSIEAILKLSAWGIKQYFADEWNIFDFFVALGSVVGVILQMFDLKLGIKGVATVLRSFRVFRLLRLLRRGGRNLYMIFNTFVITITSLSNIGALLLLIIFMYSVLGMILLGQVKRNGLMNAYMNFENFWNAFITLFTVTTGDSWNATQTSFVVWPSPNRVCKWDPQYQDYAENSETVGCGNRAIAYAFFTSYTFIVNLIFLQLFIAVILQGYDHTQVQEARLFNNEMSRVFREKWSDFDPNATTFIQLHQLRDLLFALGDPLGFDETFINEPALQDTFIASLELPIYNNFTQYQFLDVLDALSFRIMVIEKIRQQQAEELETLKTSSIPNNVIDNSDPLKSQDNNNPVGKKQSQSNLLSSQFRIALEMKVKQQLQQEMNKLLFQKKLEKISAVQDMINKEKKKQKQQKGGITALDGNGVPLHYYTGFSSQHHMAAEDTIRKMRQFLKIRRKERKRVQRLLDQDLDIAQLKIINSGPINFVPKKISTDKYNFEGNELQQVLSFKNNNAINLFDYDSVSSSTSQQNFNNFGSIKIEQSKKYLESDDF